MAEDMSETKRLLVHTANTFVPVSVIIVGVGRANKEKMKILDGDNRTLTSNEGVRAKRDIVQFVGESKNIYFLFFFFKFSDMEQTQKSIIETSKFPVRYNHDTDGPFEEIILHSRLKNKLLLFPCNSSKLFCFKFDLRFYMHY